MSATRKKQVRFTNEEDIRLLREVAAENPFTTRTKWTLIATNVSNDDFQIDGRRARERTELLVTKFRSEDRESRKQSGVDEDYDEKTVLLQDVSDLMEEELIQTKTKKDTKAKEEETAKDMRKRALEGMNKDGATSSKMKRTNVLDFMKQKQEKEFNMKESELQLRRDELQLQRERFDLEKEERKKSVELQTQLMMALMNKK